MKEVLNIKETANYLNCSVPTIRNLIRAKGIPYFKIGVKYYFSVNSLKKWISENECAML